MSIVVVAGVPAAGKTTVMKALLERRGGKKYKVVNFGDVMFNAAKTAGIVKHRDELRKQSPEFQKEIQKLAARKIADLAKRSGKKTIIVDTHCSIRTAKGYLPGLPKWVLEELYPEMIILVEADPDEILVRRVKDTSRLRDLEYVATIDEHQRFNRFMGMAYSTFSGATVKLIGNHDNSFEKAVEELITALER
ncbi:MAG: adenylate kinase [Candidatus Hydrothermarchaeota archaeon]